MVLKGSLLARWYREGTYEPLAMDDAVKQVKQLYQLFHEKHIPVIRMGLQVSDSLEQKDVILAGPYHPAFGELVYSEMFFERASALLQPLDSAEDTVCLKVHPKSISKLKGHKNNNIKKLKDLYRLRSIQVIPDSSLSINEIDISVSS